MSKLREEIEALDEEMGRAREATERAEAASVFEVEAEGGEKLAIRIPASARKMLESEAALTKATREMEEAKPLWWWSRCPGCNGRAGGETEVSGVYECRRCKGIFGRAYLGQSYALVSPRWCQCGAASDREERYYDLLCLGSGGEKRRHGWFHPACKGITQTG